ncbi:Dynein intermediate chain 2, axonemal [Eumeta japonica]|uniref:Dynein intermediate chain 2, axonemal n=1 Tax=Eumeta variegata TaxID=151549 RepID=A0A4C1TN44_EUMVA|nr:Dynein intermediate chain 2, axonemal [Eumeta japonica]
MEITSAYISKRINFGKQPLFCEQGPEMCDSIAPNVNEQKLYILRNPVHELVQNTPVFSANDANTTRVEQTVTGVNHAEGGWPVDVPFTDIESTQRYKRRIEKEDDYVHAVMKLYSKFEHYVLQNRSIEMYQSYYMEMPHMPETEKHSVRTVNVYRDGGNRGPQRPISSIDWQSEGGRQMAVTYSHLDVNRKTKSLNDCYLWDVENASQPHMTIEPFSTLLDLKYCPKDPCLLVGGLVTGQVGVWDTRVGGQVLRFCPPHVAHRDLVRSVQFIAAKSGREFFSGGADGCCKWWDMRNMEQPTDTVIIDILKQSTDEQSMAKANGITILEYEPSIPVRYMVGTENGLVVCGNRKGKTPYEMLPAAYEAHNGPVWALERSPAFLKNFLTVGDWTMRVWSEDCRESAVLWSPPNRHKLTCATWSPTRYSLILLTQANGVLTLWDLLRRQYEPIVSIQVCEEPLMKVRAHEGGTLVACGSKQGRIYMLKMSHTLVVTGDRDKGLLTSMFERESKRERILEARLREIRLKLKQAEEPPAVVGSALAIDPTVGDRDLLQAQAEYFQIAKKEFQSM